MKKISPVQTQTISYYRDLLKRYARTLIHDETEAEKLVKKVLEDQFHIDGLAPSENLRKVLKFDLLNHCYNYKYSRIFDRPVIKTSSQNRAAYTEHNKV